MINGLISFVIRCCSRTLSVLESCRSFFCISLLYNSSFFIVSILYNRIAILIFPACHTAVIIILIFFCCSIRICYRYKPDSVSLWKSENGNTVVKNTYDKEGRVVEQTDAEKGTATFKYGKNSTTTTDNEGNKTVYHYDDQYRTTSIEYPDGTTCEKTYNAENQLASETTAAGTKTYTYDAFGNVPDHNTYLLSCLRRKK